MSIQHGIIRNQTSNDKAIGHDLRSTAFGGEIRYGSPEAVANFRKILEERQAARQEREQSRLAELKQRFTGHKTAVNHQEDKLEMTAAAVEEIAQDTSAQVEILADTPQAQRFRLEQNKLPPPAPLVIEAEPRWLMDDEVKAVFAEYDDGSGLADTAERWHVNKKGKPTKEKRTLTQLTDDQVRQAHSEYWNSQESQRTVARRYGVSDVTLSTRFKKLGLPTKSTSGKRPGKAKAATAASAPKAAIPAIPATAVVPAAPVAMDPPVAPTDFIPDDFRAKLDAFRQEMAALGVQTSITMSLHLVKEVEL